MPNDLKKNGQEKSPQPPASSKPAPTDKKKEISNTNPEEQYEDKDES